jgi:hypothetical protein
MRGWFPPLTGLAFLLLATANAHAHRLVVEYRVLSGRKVQVACRYRAIPRSLPAVEARIRVFRPNDQLLAQGQTDDQGHFTFSYQRAEPLRVEAYQEGHRAEVSIDPQMLTATGDNNQNEKEKQVTTPTAAEGADKIPTQKQDAALPPEESYQEWIKQILIGVGFLLALAAFILSVRNAKKVRELQSKLNPKDPENTEKRGSTTDHTDGHG